MILINHGKHVRQESYELLRLDGFEIHTEAWSFTPPEHLCWVPVHCIYSSAVSDIFFLPIPLHSSLSFFFVLFSPLHNYP